MRIALTVPMTGAFLISIDADNTIRIGVFTMNDEQVMLIVDGKVVHATGLGYPKLDNKTSCKINFIGSNGNNSGSNNSGGRNQPFFGQLGAVYFFK